jgi:hypothetical protein
VAKVRNRGIDDAQWPWPKTVRDRILLKPDVKPDKEKLGDPKNPPLASDRLLKFIKPALPTTRLTPPPGVTTLVEEAFFRPQRQRLLRRALARVSKGRARITRALVGEDLEGVPAERRATARAEADREERMARLLERLGADLEEIERQQVNPGVTKER